jgi:hypothetical protein
MRSERGAVLLLGLCLAAEPLRGAERIESVLAEVDGHPVLLSEVRIVERLKGLGRAAALEAAIDADLMYREAARLPQAAFGREEAEAACAELRQKAPELADDVGLCALGRREAVILKYVAFRFTGEDLDAQIEAWVKQLREAALVRYNPTP